MAHETLKCNSENKIYGECPVYVDRLPPCNNACPAGENIQAWLAKAQAGQYKEAWEIIMRDNPMPAVHGRVCYHPCEGNCNRKYFDKEVSIHALERFIGDMAIVEKWSVSNASSPSGKKVLVVGAGPGGLSAAYHLRLLGHDVTIYEALPIAGGMMHVGIPDYRLPGDVLASEVKRIEEMDVKIILNHKVENLLELKEKNKFDAVFLAVGAHKGKRIDFEAKNPVPVWDAVDFLRNVKSKTLPKLGDHLLIYGGSNTAMDVARSAKRLGVQNVVIAYHRTRQRMAAFQFEIEEALEEGVELKVLRQLRLLENNIATFNVVELDAKGSPQPTGEIETIKGDMLVFALGQNPVTEFLKSVPGIEFKWGANVVVNDQMMTGANGIFAGGDMIPSDQSVTISIGHGKKAARCIDAFLRGTTYAKAPKHEIATYEMLPLWFQDKASKMEEKIVDMETRSKSFDEVVSGIDKTQATFEAKRCFSCGNCFECDGCYAVCPVDAITKLGPGLRYRYEYDKCIGCRACAEQCPCAAIKMVECEL